MYVSIKCEKVIEHEMNGDTCVYLTTDSRMKRQLVVRVNPLLKLEAADSEGWMRISWILYGLYLIFFARWTPESTAPVKWPISFWGARPSPSSPLCHSSQRRISLCILYFRSNTRFVR